LIRFLVAKLASRLVYLFSKCFDKLHILNAVLFSMYLPRILTACQSIDSGLWYAVSTVGKRFLLLLNWH